MIRAGLTSVTFRNLKPDEIIELAKATLVTDIEWGGDLHVKDESDAVYVYGLCKKTGINCCSYGSYYKVGTYNDSYMVQFEKTLKTAIKLNCETIRVWCYNKPSDDVERYSDEYNEVISEIRNIAKYSAKYGISISFEHHQKTLTDNHKRAIELINDVDYSNVFMYWQAQVPLTFEENKQALTMFKPYLKNLHISNQIQSGYLLLSEMENQLLEYVNIVKDKDIVALIEFVKGSDKTAYLQDIETLKKVLKKINE